MMKVLGHLKCSYVSFFPNLCNIYGWASLPLLLALCFEGLTKHLGTVPQAQVPLCGGQGTFFLSKH